MYLIKSTCQNLTVKLEKRKKRKILVCLFSQFPVLTPLYRNGNIFTMFPTICGNVIPFYS